MYDRMAFELGLRSDQVIIAFVLPKGLAMAPEQFIGPIGREPFQRCQPSGSHNRGGNEKVHVIGHHDVRV